jgi:hypothetical protein
MVSQISRTARGDFDKGGKKNFVPAILNWLCLSTWLEVVAGQQKIGWQSGAVPL